MVSAASPASEPTKLEIGLLLPRNGTYSKHKYETVVKSAIKDMKQKKNILTNTAIQ